MKTLIIIATAVASFASIAQENDAPQPAPQPNPQWYITPRKLEVPGSGMQKWSKGFCVPKTNSISKQEIVTNRAAANVNAMNAKYWRYFVVDKDNISMRDWKAVKEYDASSLIGLITSPSARILKMSGIEWIDFSKKNPNAKEFNTYYELLDYVTKNKKVIY